MDKKKQIYNLLKQGKSRRTICSLLGVSPNTVSNIREANRGEFPDNKKTPFRNRNNHEIKKVKKADGRKCRPVKYPNRLYFRLPVSLYSIFGGTADYRKMINEYFQSNPRRTPLFFESGGEKTCKNVFIRVTKEMYISINVELHRLKIGKNEFFRWLVSEFLNNGK